MTLESFGWDHGWAVTFRSIAAGEAVEPARVIARERESYTVHSAGAEWNAVLASPLIHHADVAADLPVVGDWVAASPPHGSGPAVIRALLRRRGAFSRKIAGDVNAQVVASNVDVIFIVAALTGDLNPRRLEHYLALGWQSGAEPVVVLTKADLVPDRTPEEITIEPITSGIPVHRISALTGAGVDALRARISTGRTIALLGSSGAGKSTLVNQLLGEERQRVGAVREDGKGGHTPMRELIPLPGGGLLLDTLGMRELQVRFSEAGEKTDAFARQQRRRETRAATRALRAHLHKKHD